MQERMESLNKKIDEFQEKMANSAESFDVRKEASKEELAKEIDKAKDGVGALKEKASDTLDDVKDYGEGLLDKAKLFFYDTKEKVEDKKFEFDKEKFARHIEREAQYAEDCMNLCLLYLEEAKLAALEAINDRIEYDMTYGEK